ncbi:MAG: hypothetical protein V4505_00590 [Pseudomonadota bacterium]
MATTRKTVTAGTRAAGSSAATVRARSKASAVAAVPPETATEAEGLAAAPLPAETVFTAMAVSLVAPVPALVSAPEVLAALGIDGLCERIEAGETLTAIARGLGVDRAAVSRWLGADTKRAARARESRALSAEAFYDQAHECVARAADAFELAKAKEVAGHLRKWAAIRNPREFGEKVAVGGAADLPAMRNAFAMTDETLLRIAARAVKGAAA